MLASDHKNNKNVIVLVIPDSRQELVLLTTRGARSAEISRRCREFKIGVVYGKDHFFVRRLRDCTDCGGEVVAYRERPFLE